jgi:hypothetical protein
MKKRIVGIENVVEEEEYNQCDEIPSFDKPHLFGTNKTPYLRSHHGEKSIYRNQGRKRKLDFC